VPVPVQRQKVAPDSWLHFTSLIAQIVCPPLQNDYGSEEAKKVGEELIEKERVTGLSESAQVGGQWGMCPGAQYGWRGFHQGKQASELSGWQAADAVLLASRQCPRLISPACHDPDPACPARRPCCCRT
jgi:hypothetical protein